MALDAVTNSTETTTEDPLSPTTIVLNALRKAGMPITNENIRRYVAGNARQPGESGTDLPGLRIEAQGDEPSGRNAPQGGPGVGQSGSATKQVEGSNKQSGYSSSTPDRRTSDASNLEISSSSPVPQQRTGPQDATDFLTPAAIAAAAIGAGAIPGMMNRGPQAEYVGNAQMPTGSMMDVNPTGLPSPDPTMQLGSSAGPMPNVAPQALPPPPTSMETAMQRAIAPSDPGGLAPIAPPQPAAPIAMPNQASGPAIPMTGPPGNMEGAPRVPLRPQLPGAYRGMPNLDAIQAILKGMKL